jgi:Lrp/AsnC family leucine-responsive transcriptional regulator
MDILDKTDTKILAELDKDSRQSFSKIGKKLKTSKEVVRYRFENLVKKGIIKNCYALVDTYKLGYLIHIVWIKFHNITSEIEQEIITKLTSTKNVGVVIKLYGKWDLVTGIWAKDTLDFYNQFNEITEKFNKYIKEKSITVEVNCNYLGQKFLYDQNIPPVKIGDVLKNEIVDNEDVEIIKNLAINSRIPSIELAAKLKLSPNAIISRIKKLEKRGIIAAYKINIDYEKLGFSHHRIFLKTSVNKKDMIRAYLETLPQVISVMNYVGYADIEFRICVKNSVEIHELLSDLREKFQDSIEEYESVMFLKSFDVLNFLPI